MKINLKQPIIDLKGKPVAELTVGEALGNILISAKVGGKMKLYVLAQKFATEDAADLDEADLELVRQSVESCEIYNSLVSGQLLVLIAKKD